MNIKPQLTTSLAQYGIEEVSTSFGIPSIAGQAIGAPISNVFLNGNITGQNIIRSVQEGLFNGAIAYAADFASDKITDNTLLNALSTRVISGAIEGTLIQKDTFKGVYDSLKQSVLGVFQVNKTLLDAISFNLSVTQNGLNDALEIHLTNIFNRQSVESIQRSGGVASALSSPKEQITMPDGVSAQMARVSSGEGVLFDSHNNLLGFERNNIYQTGAFGIGNDGAFGLTSGKSFGYLQNGSYYEAVIQNGKVTQITTIVDQAQLDIHPDKETPGIRFDVDGNISDGQITLNNQATLKISNGTLDGINFVTDVAMAPVNLVKDVAQKYANLLDEAFLKEPHTDIIYKGDIVAVDMKLDWIGDMDTMLQDTAAGVFFWVPANIRWAKAVTDAVPQIVDLMKAADNKFIFTPGVNSGIKSEEHPEYRSMDEIELLKNSFDLSDKRLMFAHSAGTEAQLKAILKAKEDGVDLSQFKFVFASPRVSRQTFVKYLTDAGVTSDQVLVVTAQTDYLHFATDKFAPNPDWSDVQSFFPTLRDYENSDGRYNYLFLEKDLTYEADKAHVREELGHGGPINGGIENHRYQARFNGVLIKDKSLPEMYFDFSQGNSQDE